MITQKEVFEVLAASTPAVRHHPQTRWVMSSALWDEVQTAFAGTMQAYEFQRGDDAVWRRSLLGVKVELDESASAAHLVPAPELIRWEKAA